ncbi:methyl-accepting chemotaxis protein [Clostridium sp. MSJ-11]|uniref:Methyl-accepting chemotaxis protein n=1 Tax=Clostridium mobile TaxID=2841512 RepID=A0ABS6EHT0_9CLOT|nr:methyl-accepting chemotaxis protein [Clostridium mobile]MBU5484770.1 methyl-accepting chemotaxis protein [Clostridium mobile]
MIKIDKKKSSLRKQWTKSIMIIIVGIYLLVIMGGYLAVKAVTKTIVLKGGPALAHIITSELEGKDINELISKGEGSETYKKIDEALDDLQAGGAGIFSKIYVASNQDNSQWKYLIGRDTTKRFNNGDSVDDEYHIENFEEALKKNTIIWDDGKTSEPSIFMPVTMKGGEKLILGVDFDLQSLARIQLIGLGILLVFLFVNLLVMRFIVGGITRKQIKSITELVEKMKEMASLEGDLTKRIEIDRNDEIGELALYTNKMLDTIQDTLRTVSELSNELKTTTEDVTDSFSRTVEGYGVMKKSVRSISERIENQSEELSETSYGVTQINNAINIIADNSQVVTEQAISTSDNAFEGNKVMEKLDEGSKEITSVVNKTSDLVKHLGEKSKEINGIADTIGAIAAQTNLLALNASIEAARAGEQGKGFAVVAEEVRKLAEESSKSAKTIFSLIEEVSKGIEDAVNSMELVNKSNGEQNKFVEDVILKFTHIADAINEVSQNVEEVSASTEEMSSNISVITEKFENLANVSEENSRTAEEVSLFIDNQSMVIDDLSNTINNLNSKSDELKVRLTKLKLD